MSNENEKDSRKVIYTIILHITILLNFLDLTFSSLFIHFHGSDLEANIISRFIYENYNMSGLIIFKVITLYLYIITMSVIGYTRKTYLISHIIMWIFVYITFQHIIIFEILEGYNMLPESIKTIFPEKI